MACSSRAPDDTEIDLNEKIRTKEVEELCQAFAGIADPDDVSKLLEDLCTIREIQDFAQRLQVAKMLDNGESYTLISEKTGASATTIARVSKALNYGVGGYRVVLDNLMAREDEDAAGNASPGSQPSNGSGNIASESNE